MKNWTLKILAVFVLMTQTENLQAAEFSSSNGGIFNILKDQVTGRIEIRVTPPRHTSYRLLVQKTRVNDENINEQHYVDIIEAQITNSWSYNEATNTTLFVMRRNMGAQIFSLAPDTLTGENVKPFYYRVGGQSLANAWYDFETYFLVTGKMYFGVNFRRRYPSTFKENLIGMEMMENDIPYDPALFTGGKPTNEYFAQRLDEEGIKIDAALATQGQGGLDD